MKAPTRHSLSKECGFTLLEMIIAVTLVAMMAVGLWSVFRTAVDSWRKGTEFMDANQRHRTILDLVKKQMASIYGVIAPVDMQSGGAIYPLFAGAETSLQFISLSSLRFSENPGLTMVSYDVVQDEEGSYALVEREERYVGLDPNSDTFLDRNDVKTTTIFDNLVSCMFEYFDPGDAQRPTQWIRQWDSKEMGRLPVAISMTMISQGPRGGRFNRHLVVPILAKPYDRRLGVVDPFESRLGRFRASDARSRR